MRALDLVITGLTRLAGVTANMAVSFAGPVAAYNFVQGKAVTTDLLVDQYLGRSLPLQLVVLLLAVLAVCIRKYFTGCANGTP